MSKPKKKIPTANNSGEKKQQQQQEALSKKLHVKVLNDFILKNTQQSVKCYIDGNPDGIYHVQSKITMNTTHAFKVDSRIVITDKPFNLIIQNCEPTYGGQLDFKKDEIIAEAHRLI